MEKAAFNREFFLKRRKSSLLSRISSAHAALEKVRSVLDDLTVALQSQPDPGRLKELSLALLVAFEGLERALKQPIPLWDDAYEFALALSEGR